MAKINEEIQELFEDVRVALGAPIRSVELDNEQLCSLLRQSVGDYASKVQNEIIDNNWVSLYGKKVSQVNSGDLGHALSVKSLDMSKDYSYWFSKQVGLQQEGPWELKKDFITIERGKQVYVIPSGRTVNKVMYVNPPMTDLALFANYGGLGTGYLPGLGPVGGVGGGMGYGAGMGGFYTTQVCDVAYMAGDLNFKRRLFSGDLVYKITAGPDGTHLLHLLSTPGSRLSLNFAGSTSTGLGLLGCEVWYTYYETNGEDDELDCMRAHSDDVILSPDQIPLKKMDYTFLNDPTKVIIRQILTAKAMQTLGRIRGKFSGKVNIPQAEMTMDYQMLTQQGNEEYKTAMDNLQKRLERLRPVNVIKEQAEIVEQNHNIQKKTPLGIYVI